MISLALFEPDIPQNTGTILRMADCFGIHVDIIEPCGFIFGGAHMRRAGMDYLNTADYTLHANFEEFLAYVEKSQKRLVLATTKTDTNYTDFRFQPNDIIMFGKESAGVPAAVHDLINHKITIKMVAGKRSLNLAVSTAIITGEAIRQLNLK
ncbi:MAG: tRNA (cytidine(34)-2'-O)-methyltransferase [Alphaproteobacteria bacterium]|jgi:tRNA (cytidine/uridine-2'-O-)-methyltransferase|nr:tRNA (cytidine(34)-2'-O)-methyltransferase [Alphaproteobacteria bacterium]